MSDQPSGFVTRLNCSLAPRCKAAATHVVTFYDHHGDVLSVWHRCGAHLPSAGRIVLGGVSTRPLSLDARAKFETRAVLAGAYKRKRLDTMLTHTVEVDHQGIAVRVLCDRVELDSLADEHAHDPTAPPSCPRCRAALRKQTN